MWTNSRGWLATFSRGALCCFTWRWHISSIFPYAPLPAQPFEARIYSGTLDLAFLWGLSAQFLHGTLSEQSPCVWLAVPTGTMPPGTILAAPFGRGCPSSTWDGCVLAEAAWAPLGWSAWVGTGPWSWLASLQSLYSGHDQPAGPLPNPWWSCSSPIGCPQLDSAYADYSCMF